MHTPRIGHVLRNLFMVLVPVVLFSHAAYSQSTGVKPPNEAAGRPAGSFQLSGFENVNLFSGNLNFSMPLLTVGGRGEVKVPISLSVDSTQWKLKKESCGNEGPSFFSSGIVVKVTDTDRQAGYWDKATDIVYTIGLPDNTQILDSGTISYQSNTICSYYTLDHEGSLRERPGYGPGVLQSVTVSRGGNIDKKTSGKVLTKLIFTLSDGTEYALVDWNTYGKPYQPAPFSTFAPFSRGNLFVTTDGSAISFISDAPITETFTYDQETEVLGLPSGLLLMPDGTRYRIVNGLVKSIRDPNGNLTFYDYGEDRNDPNTFRKLLTVTDSIGRTVHIDYKVPNGIFDSDGSPKTYDRISYSGMEGKAREIKLWHANLRNALRGGSTIQTKGKLFPNYEQDTTQTNALYNPTDVVTAVELPDRRNYSLSYNPYGELARVVLPTGGAIEYDYSTITTSLSIQRRVRERRIYRNRSDSLPESRQIYRAELIGGVQGVPPATGVTVEQQSGESGQILSKEKHYFYGDVMSSSLGFYASYSEGKEYKTEVLDPNNVDAVLRTVETSAWRQRPAARSEESWYTGITESSPARDPRLAETITTLEDGQVSKLTSINPNAQDRNDLTAVAFDQFNNQHDVWEYDYGRGAPGPLLRHTHTEYVDTSNYTAASESSPHLRRLLKLQQVFSAGPSGTEVLNAQTEYGYDELELLAASPGGADADLRTAGWSDPGQLRGNNTTMKRALLVGGPYAVTRVQYDRVGNAINAWDANGNRSTTSYADNYSDNSNRNSLAYPTKTITSVPDQTSTGEFGSHTPLETTLTYDYSTGLVALSKDSNGNVTSYEYKTALDRLARVIRPSGVASTEYRYGDYVSSPSGENYVETFTGLDDSRSTYSFQFFDGLGRPTRSFQHVGGMIGSGADTYLTVDTQYDAMGRVQKVSIPYISSGADSIPNQSGQRTETTYDSLGRVRTVTTLPDNATITTFYIGNTVKVVDQANNVRRNMYDALGRLVRVDEPNSAGDLDKEDSPTTYYNYDALDNLRKVDQGGQQRFYLYDLASRLIRIKNPEQETNASLKGADALTGNAAWSASYEYDAGGNLKARVDARGVRTDYNYDALNRLITIDYSDRKTPYYDIEYHFDGAINGKGRAWYSNAGGNSSEGSTVEQTVIDAYDVAGRPLKGRQHFKTDGVWSPPFEINRTYDLAGHITSETYPSKRTVNYRYDIAGRLSSFTGSLGDGAMRSYSSEITYDRAGRFSQEKFGTDTPIFNKRFYNDRSQLNEIRVGTTPNDSGFNRGAILNVYSAQAAWTGSGPDNNGNLRKQMLFVPKDDADGFTDTTFYYDYDKLNRLDVAREVSGSQVLWAQDFEYDRWGNRLINQSNTTEGISRTKFVVDSMNNRVYAPGDLAIADPSQRSMRYDATGNLIADIYSTHAARIEYDAENRMTAAYDSLSPVVSRYNYNADGARVRRNVTGEETWQVYGFNGELLSEYAAKASPGSPQKEYGYRNGEMLITALAEPSLQPAAPSEKVWFDDDTPAGAVLQSNGEEWNWTKGPPVPISGGFAHKSGDSGGFHNHYFTSATQTLDVKPGDKLFTYVYIDFTNVPSELMLQWYDGSKWYSAYWGADNINWVSDRQRIGPMPSSAGWVRLEVPASLLGIEGKKLSGMAFNVWDGRVSWDKAGVAATIPGETVWIEDNIPAGGTEQGNNEGWSWSSNNPPPFSGASAHQSATLAGFHSHYFLSATDTITASDGDRLFTYAYLDPANPTSELMLQWYDGSKWYSAYWGADNINWVSDRLYMGPLPKVGEWVKLSVPASAISVAGKTLSGMAFNTWGGRVSWDHAGKSSGSDIRWAVTDQIGTPRIVLDKSGSLKGVTRHDYLPFGEELFAGTGKRTTQQGYGATDGLRQKFTGYERDNETGLDFAQARYYSPTQGRFTSIDPLLASAKSGMPQTWNRYTYGLNNPLAYIDPTGLIWGTVGDGNVKWYKDKEAMGKAHATEWKEMTYGIGNDRYVRLDPNGPNANGSTQEERQGWSVFTQPSASANDGPAPPETPTCDCCNCSTYQRWEYTSVADYMRKPDAISVSYSALTTGQTFTLDANGNFYMTPFDVVPRNPLGPEKVRGSSWANTRSVMRIGGNISLVWLNQFNVPSSQQMNNFFTGPSFTGSVGTPSGGGGITYTPGSGTATNLGIYTPGVGVSGGMAFKIIETPFRWR